MTEKGSGRSVLLVIGVVVVLVVAALALAYVLRPQSEPDIAPGTILQYDVSIDGGPGGIYVKYCVGESHEEYFYMTVRWEGGEEKIHYTKSMKDVENRKNARMTKIVEMQTMDGLKSLEEWEYTTDDYEAASHVRSYFDPDSGIEYKLEVTMSTGEFVVYVLFDYRLDYNKDYFQSWDVGISCSYVSVGPGVKMRAEITCVADCDEARYGVTLEYGGKEIHYVSDTPQGLPHTAVKTGETAALTTVDGNRTVELWKQVFRDGEITFYVDPEDKVIYRFVVKGPPEQTFDLTKKAIHPRGR